MGILLRLLEPPNPAKPNEKHISDVKGTLPSGLTSCVQDVHAAVAYIARYMEEGTEKLNAALKTINSKEPVVEISSCRYACHCCFLHEPCKVHILVSIPDCARTCLPCGCLCQQ